MSDLLPNASPPSSPLARRTAVVSCWLCGIRLHQNQMVPDGGSACLHIRWYCKDIRACTDRWSSVQRQRRAAGTAAPDKAEAAPPCRRQSHPLRITRASQTHGWPRPVSPLAARPTQITGIGPVLMAHSQPDLPRSRRAEECAEAMDVNRLPTADAARLVQLLDRLLPGPVLAVHRLSPAGL